MSFRIYFLLTLWTDMFVLTESTEGYMCTPWEDKRNSEGCHSLLVQDKYCIKHIFFKGWLCLFIRTDIFILHRMTVPDLEAWQSLDFQYMKIFWKLYYLNSTQPQHLHSCLKSWNTIFYFIDFPCHLYYVFYIVWKIPNNINTMFILQRKWGSKVKIIVIHLILGITL